MGTNLPTEVGQILSAPTSIDYNYPTTGVWDASYDICLDSTPKTTGVNQKEIMIWFNHQGSIQPVGSPVGNTTIEGKNFVVWDGSNGMNNAMAYVATEPIEVWSFDVMSFVDHTADHRLVVPHEHPGRLGALERRCGSGGRFVLGESQLKTTLTPNRRPGMGRRGVEALTAARNVRCCGPCRSHTLA